MDWELIQLLGQLLASQQQSNNPVNPAFLQNAGGIGGQINNAMGLIGQTAQSNANRAQQDDQLNAQLMASYWNALSPVEQARITTGGNVDIENIRAQSAQDILSNEGYQRQFNAPVDIENIRAQGLLDQERERTNRASTIFGGLGGLLGGLFGGGGAGSPQRITGFSSTDGAQRAMMPTPPQNQLPTGPPAMQPQGGGGQIGAPSAPAVNIPTSMPPAGAASAFGPGQSSFRGLVEHLQRIGQIPASSNQFQMAGRRFG